MRKYLFYILLIVFISFTIFNESLGIMDEIWSYSYARNVANGLIPYKDFNIVSTPLSCFINSILLSFNNSLFTFRIVFVLYFVYLIFILDKLMGKLKINELIKYLSILLICYLLVKFCYLDYNILCILLILSIIYLELFNKNSLLIPMLVGLVIISKQSVGVLVCICYLVNLLIRRESFKSICYKFLFVLIPFIIFVIYLLFTGSFISFIDMGIMGIFTFSNKVVRFKVLLIILLLLIPSFIIYLKSKNSNKNILFLYSLSALIISYPIVDIIHAVISIIPLIIYLVYYINSIKFNIKFNILYLFIPILFVSSFISISHYISSYKSSISVYKYIPSSIEKDNDIKLVSSYLDSNTYILNYKASLYMLSVNRYNKYFDLFNNGNFGINGEKEIYYLLDKKCKVLIGTGNSQEPIKYIDYVKDNYKSSNIIGKLSVYINY